MSNTKRIGQRNPLVLCPDEIQTGHHVCEHGFPTIGLVIRDEDYRRPVEIRMHADFARSMLTSLQASIDKAQFKLDLQTGAA